MSVTADRRVDESLLEQETSTMQRRLDGFPDVKVVVAIRLAADGSPTFLFEEVQIFLTSIFGLAVDWKLGSHLE